MCSVQCSEYIIVVVLLYLETFICHWFFVTSLKTKGSDKNETIYKEKRKRKHVYLELHALTFSYIEVMNFVGSGFLSQVYQASPDWTKPTGPNGATIRFHLKETNSLKFASNMHVLRVQQPMSQWQPLLLLKRIYTCTMYYIYSVRQRDLLINVIDWILSFQWKLWTTPSTWS